MAAKPGLSPPGLCGANRDNFMARKLLGQSRVYCKVAQMSAILARFPCLLLFFLRPQEHEDGLGLIGVWTLNVTSR